MTRRELVLAAMATAGEGASYSPVQLQKLFFMLDREGPHLVGGPHFAFEPYDYGPFDRAVYVEVEQLVSQGLAIAETNGRYKHYTLTPSGLSAGRQAAAHLSAQARSYIDGLAVWVRSLTFQQLVGAIYERHPDMRAKSIFVG